MGLICPKCGVDNLLTAIFCRGCGEKLDLNEMKPEALLNDKHSKSKSKGPSAAQKTFVGVFFGLIGIMVLLAMCPVGVKGTQEEEPNKEVAEGFALLNKAKASAPAETAPAKGKKPAKGKSGKKVAPKAAKLPNLTMDSDTASKLISAAMGMPKQEWSQGPLVPQHFSVDFKDGNIIKIVVSTKAFGVFPLACSAKARIEASAEGQGPKYDYILASPKLGALPLFVYGELSLELIQSLMDTCPAFQVIKNASELTTSEGSISVKF